MGLKYMENLPSIIKQARDMGLQIPYSNDILPLLDNALIINGKKIANRIAFHPMEGSDGKPDGLPGKLTFRRYKRFAHGAPGLIWAEATAVVPEGRANPHQLWLNKDNVDSFKALTEDIKQICLRENGFEPIIILQLTHSGRYSKPEGVPAPIIAYNNPLFEKDKPIDEKNIVTDDYLRGLEEIYGKTAALAQDAGFDGADIKCCHRYLLSELLSAYERPGDYGGSFENRVKMFLNCVKSAKAEVKDNFIVTTRFNTYDGFPYPYGFGTAPGGSTVPDHTDGLRLIGILHKKLDMGLINITMGNPYVNPNVNRPANTNTNRSVENPLVGAERILNASKIVQKEFPGLKVICSGLSFWGGNMANVAAGAVEEGYASIAGFGRQAFARPDFLKDIKNPPVGAGLVPALGSGADKGRAQGPPLRENSISENKDCLACGKCSELLRAGSPTGCVTRDGEVYLPFYKKYVQNIT